MKVSLPRHLRVYRRDAESLIRQGLIREVEFSGATYQILVEDPSSLQACWVFLQLKGMTGIRDGFCTGEHAEPEGGCVHMAAAYLGLFKKEGQPLHRRFAQSLWNHLCRIYEKKLGGDPGGLLREGSSSYYGQSKSGKKIFMLQPLTEAASQRLCAIFYEDRGKTEETSIKFSGLSQEEIALWRGGKPSASLRYDLSFWSELAKWFLEKQEKGDAYQISFRYSKKGLPNWLQVDFEEMRAGFYLAEANLPELIDSLRTVESPLAVYYADRNNISHIVYDTKNQALCIYPNKGEESGPVCPDADLSTAVAIGGWRFIPGRGFYAEETHELLRHPILHGEDIAHALTHYTRLIASLIVECAVHRDPTPISYQIYFDPNWNLHVEAYLFEPGDLSKGDSWLMQHWAYLDGEGFYAVEGEYFSGVETIIGRYEVSEFVGRNRSWLNLKEGFQTHVRSIEYQLAYEVSEHNRLTFRRSLAGIQGNLRQHDFGTWVYLEGHGFYSKTAGAFHSLLKPGISLNSHQVPLFIRLNREELASIPKFFAERCPVAQAGLNIELLDSNAIKIEPVYKPSPGYKGKAIHFFDDFAYVEGEGFHELPAKLRLPERFRHPIEISGEELLFFLTHEIDALPLEGSRMDPRLLPPVEYRLVADLVEPLHARGKGWYRLRLFYQTERGLISIKALHEALTSFREGEQGPFAFFHAGRIDLRDERYAWLRQLGSDRFEPESAAICLNALECIRLNAFTPITPIDRDEEGAPSANKKSLEELTQWHMPEMPDAGGLLGHLRPYQEIGLRWLWFLYGQGLSGLLCDDMGLGKTHQAMALLASVANFYDSQEVWSRPRFLIVCPTSVVHHWEEKLRHFLPKLRVCTFYGAKRSLEDFHQHYDVLLTSYGILRNEQPLLSGFIFEIAIFDEIQTAKNQLSRVYTALTRLKAEMKVGLTGTPIENHLRELKSLFDIVLPGYMPPDRKYREFFMKPIEKVRDEERQELLHRLVRPFVLRRTKEAVLQELPEKMEEISYCDLLPHQAQLYGEVLQQRRRVLLEALHDDAHPVPYLHIFALLSSLKQICDHPAVYLKIPSDYREYSSGKWELFLELLREARESGQKVVVFSQYLAMLDIIETHLAEEKIGFAALRGATRNRQAQLCRFKEDPSCEVFVGSLQAAGLGIDLTAASVVIHYDRWWNAARENQATDRVHRMGQRRGVQVFKLVTQGTFETKIDEMINRKGKLMEGTVKTDEQDALKTFSRHELMQLLELADLPDEP